MAGGDERVLLADSIGKRFGRRQVLKAATLVVPAGRVTALLGRNGSGKTTLLRIASGVLRPDYGTVRIDGEIHASPRLANLARWGLFYLPDRRLLPPWPKVGRLVAMVAARHGGPDPSGLLRRLDLEEQVEQPVRTLSGGERRRVELATALARRPRCLLADEPFVGIPPRDGELVARELRGMADTGCGVVVTGHEVEGLLDLADAVTWLTGGTTLALGSPEAAVRHPAFSARYLGRRRSSV